MDYPLQAVVGDIPKPLTTAKARTQPRKYPFHEQAVGQFFFVPGSKPSTMLSLAYSYGKRLSAVFKTRHLYMRLVDGQWKPCTPQDKDAQLGVAVYRTA